MLRVVRKIIPSRFFAFVQPWYHRILSGIGAVIYGFPARGVTIIGITGTKGKSTVTYMIARALEDQDIKVAAIGSLGYKIREKEWPNNLHMTMPGRMKLQKFLHQARKQGVTHVVLECTSEGMEQGRLFAIPLDGAVLTNIHPEHIERHVGFDNYIKAKQILFRKAKNIHVLNAEDGHKNKFRDIPAKTTVLFGFQNGGPRYAVGFSEASTTQLERNIKLKLKGDFNILNALAALATIKAYGFDVNKAQKTIENIDFVAGRMEYVKAHERQNFDFIVDYAHTPESLESVYKFLRTQLDQNSESKLYKVLFSDAVQGSDEHRTEPYMKYDDRGAESLTQADGSLAQARTRREMRRKRKLICIFGSDGGGRDTWKRPVFGRIASQYCDEIILTSENPYDTDPDDIADEIEAGIQKRDGLIVKRIIDRYEAMKQAVRDANSGDIIVITGKGTEDSIVMANGKKIPWLDSLKAKQAILEVLKNKI